MGHRRIETGELGKRHKGGASESNGKFEWELSGRTSQNGWHFGQRDSWQTLEACRNAVCGTTFVLVCGGGSLHEVRIGGKGLAAYEVINGSEIFKHLEMRVGVWTLFASRGRQRLDMRVAIVPRGCSWQT